MNIKLRISVYAEFTWDMYLPFYFIFMLVDLETKPQLPVFLEKFIFCVICLGEIPLEFPTLKITDFELKRNFLLDKIN